MQTATFVHAAERRAVAFGPFPFDRISRFLSKDGVEVPLPPRVLAVPVATVDARAAAPPFAMSAGERW